MIEKNITFSCPWFLPSSEYLFVSQEADTVLYLHNQVTPKVWIPARSPK